MEREDWRLQALEPYLSSMVGTIIIIIRIVVVIVIIMIMIIVKNSNTLLMTIN